jgi:hypothetical protein
MTTRSTTAKIAGALLALAALGGASVAQARDVNWSVGISAPLPGVSIGVNNGYYPGYSQPYPVYSQPYPVYSQPYPVYTQPPVYSYYQPAPVYYAPRPVYVRPPVYIGGHGHWHNGHRGHGHRR